MHFFIFLSILSQYSFAQDGYQELDRVVASVDGEAITASELNKRASLTNQQDLKSLLLEDVLQKEAEQRGLAVKDEDIENYIEEIKKQNNLTEKEFNEVLAQRNLTLELYKAQIKKEIMRGKVMNQIIRGKIHITDEDVSRYLENHAEINPPLGSYRISLIKGDKEQLALLRKTALDKAISLKDLKAPNYEDLGYVLLEDLRDDYKNVISKYSAGEISEIASLEDGDVLFEIVAKIEKKGEIDQALKEEIKDTIFKQRYQEEINKLLGDDLFKKHHLEIIK